MTAQKLLEVGGQRRLVRNGAVELDDLVAAAGQQRRMVAHEQGGHHQRHEQGHQGQGRRLDAAEEPQGEGCEEVGDLTLGDLGGAQADD